MGRNKFIYFRANFQMKLPILKTLPENRSHCMGGMNTGIVKLLMQF